MFGEGFQSESLCVSIQQVRVAGRERKMFEFADVGEDVERREESFPVGVRFRFFCVCELKPNRVTIEGGTSVGIQRGIVAKKFAISMDVSITSHRDGSMIANIIQDGLRGKRALEHVG